MYVSNESSNSRGISLLSVIGKQYRSVQKNRVRVGTKCAIVEEQSGFMQGRGYMDQAFAVRQVCEMYIVNMKDVYWSFMDLKKV